MDEIWKAIFIGFASTAAFSVAVQLLAMWRSNLVFTIKLKQQDAVLQEQTHKLDNVLQNQQEIKVLQAEDRRDAKSLERRVTRLEQEA